MKKYINEYPDFPKKGINFKDVMPLLKNPEGWAQVMKELGEFCDEVRPDLIVGIESRGFIVGTALATVKNIGFVPIRKKGKLPGKIVSEEYELEYGTDTLEVQSNVFDMGALGVVSYQARVLVLDDLLATGGTARAATNLINRAGGDIMGYGFIIELNGLNGRDNLQKNVPIKSLITYD